MIPEFPEFKKLELTDKADVESFTSKFPPYSDYSFVSMWAWDIKGDMRISQLNGNLVVLFTDYLTGKPFYSFLGNNKTNETAEKLMELSVKDGLAPILKLLPEESLKDLNLVKFKIEEDRDHFDYLYLTQELKDMTGGKFAKKRNQVSLFLKNYPGVEAKIIDLKDKNIQGGIVNLFLEWLKRKVAQEEIFESHEEVAVSRLILAIDKCKLVGVGVFLNEKLIGFFINELTKSEHVIAHASKIDKSFDGINSFLMKQNAEILFSLKKLVFNYEQDLGIENLRVAKTRFRPTVFLKKYKLTHNSVKVI